MTIHRVLCLILAVTLLPLIILEGCEDKQKTDNPVVYTSFRDIPGVTSEEIKAVESLREKYDSFSYGMLASTEAFYNENGEIRGYSALFCEWLTGLFDIKFTPKLLEWGELFPRLDADFSGELTATEERKRVNGYFFTDAIAERSTKYFRVAGSQPRSEMIKAMKAHPLKLGFLSESTTSVAAIAKLEEAKVAFEPFYLNDYATVFNMLASGEIDAFVDEMISESVFDTMGNIVADDFFPLIIEPISLSTQNPELAPIISIVQKAIKSGQINHLSDLYEQGMKEYARHKLYIQFDEREQAYLRENKAVAYLAEFDNYPLSFYNKNEKQWQGVTFDILSEITALTGLTFEPVNKPDLSFSDLMGMLENGEGAMISELLRNDAREGRFIWSKTNTSMNNNYAAISLDTLPNIALHKISRLRVGVQKETAYADLFKKWFPHHQNVIEYDTTDAAFDGLENGEVDILMASMQNLLSATNYREKTNFKANMIFDHTFTSFFGFNRNEEVLCSIVDKTMSVIDNKSISTRWMQKIFDYRSKIIQSQRPWLIATITFSLIIIALILVMYRRSRNVGKQLDELVRQRTRELLASRQDLRAALRDAEMANKAKSSFLATMSHEIRTPMNAIIGIAQIQLQKGSLPEDYAMALEKIYGSGNHLLGIINDILDLSKIESGKLELHPVEYDIPSLINDTVQLNVMRIASKPIEFVLDIDENLPMMLYGDDLRLKQILNNLLSNAIKYTEKGQVKMSVSHAPRGEDTGLRLVIEDTGQGMRPKDLEKLFSIYSRFNIEANRSIEGTGLGLNITKSLVTMMDGTIHAESAYGKGSVFTVEVTQKTVACEAIGRELAERLRNFMFMGNKQFEQLKILREPMPYGKVLVVDDIETNLYVASGLLSPYRLEIETADSGFAAIAMIQDGRTYDIIFMDHMMPQMDGIETTQKLRELGYRGTIIALTANAMAANEKLFRQNGFDGFISKPIEPRKLNSVLERYVRDCHPEEAEKYRKEAEEQALETAKSPKLLAVFRRDAEKAVATLRRTLADDDMKLFTTTVHAMKSALANIGELEASRLAFALEQAGLDGDRKFIAAHTENFVKTLETLIQTLTEPLHEDAGDIEEDTAILKEQLLIVKAACENYDDAAAYAALDRLKEKPWKSETGAALENIRDMLFLHSDFEGAGAEAEKWAK